MSIGGVGGDRLAEILQGMQTGGASETEGAQSFPAAPQQGDTVSKYEADQYNALLDDLGAGSPSLELPDEEALQGSEGVTESSPVEEGADFLESLAASHPMAKLALQLMGEGKLELALSVYFDAKVPENPQNPAFRQALFEIIQVELQESDAPFPETLTEQLQNTLDLLQLAKSYATFLTGVSSGDAADAATFIAEAEALLGEESVAGLQAASLLGIVNLVKELTGMDNTALTAATALQIAEDPFAKALAAEIARHFEEFFDGSPLSELATILGVLAFVGGAAAAQLELDQFSGHAAFLPPALAALIFEALPPGFLEEYMDIETMEEIGKALLLGLAMSYVEGQSKAESDKALDRLFQDLVSKVVSAIADAMVRTAKIVAEMSKEFMEKKAIENDRLKKGLELMAENGALLVLEVVLPFTETLQSSPDKRYAEKAFHEVAPLLGDFVEKLPAEFRPEAQNVTEALIDCLQSKKIDRFDGLIVTQSDLIEKLSFHLRTKLQERGEEHLPELDSFLEELMSFIRDIFRDAGGVSETTAAAKAA